MPGDAPRLDVEVDTFPLRGVFRISRGARTEAVVVTATVRDGEHQGRGECTPYARYGETVESVVAAIEAMAPDIAMGMDRTALNDAMPSGAARNAIDCALWDLEAKRSGRRAWEFGGFANRIDPVLTVYTLSVDTPDTMARAAREAADRPMLKVKMTGDGDVDRLRAVRQEAPKPRLIVDANEAWTIDHLREFAPIFADLGVEMIEQPLPADADGPLVDYRSPVPIGADESCHDRASLAALAGKYSVINIKLDKTGGLTEALALRSAGRDAGYKIMVGCMMASSLAMAPATLVAQGADFVDLDGPLWLATDRTPALTIIGGQVHPPDPALWG